MGTLEKKAGSASLAAETVEMSLSQWLNLRDGAVDSKTGTPRGMRKSTARRIEKAFNLNPLWLDTDHCTLITTKDGKAYQVNEPELQIPRIPQAKTQRDKDIDEIKRIAERLDPTGIGLLLGFARRIQDERPAQKTLSSST